MSISKFQDRLFNKGGCGSAILIGCAMVFGAFAFQYWGKANMFNQGQDAGGTTHTIATVDGTPIDAGSTEENVQMALQQQGVPTTAPEPVATAYGRVLEEKLATAAVPAVAKSLGVQFSDDQLRQAEKSQIDMELMRMKMQFAMQGQIKYDASEADWDAAFKARTGKSLAEVQQSALDKLNADLQDPAKRQAEEGGLGRDLLIAAMASKVNATDADVKAGYNQYTFKRILLAQKPVPSPSVPDRVAQVQKDLASGTPFEREMNRLSDDPPKPKQTVSQSTVEYSADQLTEDKALAPLKSLKIGAVSTPVASGEGTAIYKLISIKNQAPADFAKNIANYKKQYQQKMAAAALDDKVKAVVDSDTKWTSAGFKAIYDVTRPNIDPKKANELYTEAKEAIQKTEGYDLRPAELAEYTAFNLVWNAPGADKVKLRPERIQVLTDYLNNMENFDVRMELERMYEADHNGKLASEALKEAASSNNVYDNIGQSHFGDVAAALTTLKSAGLLDPQTEKDVTAIQAEWKKDKALYDTEQAQERAEMAKQQAADDAARKKAAAEQAAALKKGPTVKIKDTAGTAPKGGISLPPGTTPVTGSPSPTQKGGITLPPSVTPPAGSTSGAPKK